MAAQPDGQARVNALLDPKAAVGYIAGEIQYLDDQLQNIPGFGDLSPQDRQRIELIGYNQGWDNLETNIELRSFRTVIDRSDYDNLTLDEYERWRDQ